VSRCDEFRRPPSSFPAGLRAILNWLKDPGHFGDQKKPSKTFSQKVRFLPTAALRLRMLLVFSDARSSLLVLQDRPSPETSGNASSTESHHFSPFFGISEVATTLCVVQVSSLIFGPFSFFYLFHPAHAPLAFSFHCALAPFLSDSPGV